MALLGALTVWPGSATAQDVALSTGCQAANDPALDGQYLGQGVFGQLFIGEQVTATAGPPPVGAPTRVIMNVDLVITETTAFPGTVSYTFTNDAVRPVNVLWHVTGTASPGATWTVSCAATSPVQTSLQADPVVTSVFQLRARLTETESGAPLGGQVVTMSTAAGLVCQATTDENGIATCNGLPAAPSIVLENGYTAAFAGSSDLGPSSSRATLLAPGVRPAPTPVPGPIPDVTPPATGPSRLSPPSTPSSRPGGAPLPATGSNGYAMPLGLALVLIGGNLFRATRRALAQNPSS